MGIELAGTRGTKSGFRMGNVDLRRYGQDGKRTFRNCAADWSNWKTALAAIRERLAKVMIYERDALEFIALMGTPDCLLYLDPPYQLETRTRTHGGSRYEVDMTAEQHEQLIAECLVNPAMIVLSGYPHPSYDPLERSRLAPRRERLPRQHEPQAPHRVPVDLPQLPAMSTASIPQPPQVDAALLAWAEQLLLAHGYSVTHPDREGEWIAPIDLYRRLGEHPDTVYRSRLRSPLCPPFPRRCSTTGRLLQLQPTPTLLKFLTGPKTQGYPRG